MSYEKVRSEFEKRRDLTDPVMIEKVCRAPSGD